MKKISFIGMGNMAQAMVAGFTASGKVKGSDIYAYAPNSQNELARLPYRMEWEDDFLEYVKGLEKDKPVIYAGDLNVARLEIDIKNPKTNRRNAGFTDEEREKIQKAVDSGFIDTFRFFNPQIEGIFRHCGFY